MQEIPGTGFDLKAELVLLAMGFVHPVHEGMVDELAVELDARGNVLADTEKYVTSLPERVRGGRHAKGPIAGGLGDPRGPPMRPRRGRVPDGRVVVAAMRGRGPSVPMLLSIS